MEGKSTKAVVIFRDVNDGAAGKIVVKERAYADGLGKDLMLFLEECKGLGAGSGFKQPGLLAARCVAFLGGVYRRLGSRSAVDFSAVELAQTIPEGTDYVYEVYTAKIVPEDEMPQVTIGSWWPTGVSGRVRERLSLRAEIMRIEASAEEARKAARAAKEGEKSG